MPTKRHMVQRSAVVAFFSFLGSLTGILVEASIAAKLGLSTRSDTFYVALTVPNVIASLIAATGQFSLVPFFAALDSPASRERLWKGVSYAINVVFLGSCGVALAGAASSVWLVRGIAPGLAPAQTELAARIARWLFLMVIPAGVAETFRSFLFSQHRFVLSSASTFLRNATVIACILVGYPRYGLYSMVLGYLAGSVLQLALLGGQAFMSFPLHYSWTWRSGGEAFRNLRGAGAAQVTTALMWQGVVIVERMIASFLPAGTLTALNYGLKVVSTLVELLAGSVGTAALPGLARAASLEAPTEERKMFRDALEISMVLVIPVTVFCLMLDRNIIRLLFERGNFTPDATALMTMIFFYYMLALVPFSFIRILTFYLFARREPMIFVRLAGFLYSVTVALDLFYVVILRLGARGIPLAMLTSLLLTSALAFRRNIAGLLEVADRSLGIFTVKNLAGAALAALVVWRLRVWTPGGEGAVGNFWYLCFLCGAGSLVFLATLAASRAIRLSQLAAFRRREEEL
jgi:putative peptidoglycan lipid II flippase